MKKFKKYVLMTHEELAEHVSGRYEDGLDEGKARIEQLEKALERKSKAYEKLDREYDDQEKAIRVLQDERDDVRDIVKKSMDNKDLAAVLKTKEEHLDRRAQRLNELEQQIEDTESKQYKEGYADGVSDGVRKINEITAQDRENAMKVAMIAASSHTPVANLKELNSVHNIATGTADKKA